MTGEPLLEVRDLRVSFRTEDGLVRAVDGVSLSLSEGETLGIVGESGSGKSVTMMSVMRLINDPNARFEGQVLYKGHDLMTLNQDQMREIRGTGIAMIFQDPWLWFKGLIIPWITLSILYIGFYGRVLRANILETQNEDFVRTARAKGLSERRVLLRHTLRTSMITFVSLFGLDFGALVAGGALLIEVVFAIHGVGYLTWQALANLDLPTIMATVVYGAFFIVLVNAIVDIAYAWLDPRIRPT